MEGGRCSRVTVLPAARHRDSVDIPSPFSRRFSRSGEGVCQRNDRTLAAGGAGEKRVWAGPTALRAPSGHTWPAGLCVITTKVPPTKHGLPSHTMARIASDCGAMAAPCASNGPGNMDFLYYHGGHTTHIPKRASLSSHTRFDLKMTKLDVVTTRTALRHDGPNRLGMRRNIGSQGVKWP